MLFANWKIELINFIYEFWLTLLRVLKISCLLIYLIIKMTSFQRLGLMDAIDNDIQTCYHQCTQCGIIFGCKLVRAPNRCDNPFYRGRCNICNGVKN